MHIGTATKSLTSLHKCGFLERRKSKRKTRPAYEYRLKVDRIVLELDLEETSVDVQDDVSMFYLSFLNSISHKATRMGWASLEEEVARELGYDDESFADIVAKELFPENDGQRPDPRPVFKQFVSKVRKAFVSNLGESATLRIFKSAAKEASEDYPEICEKYHLLEDVEVGRDG